VKIGCEQLKIGDRLPRHQHRQAYAAVVLSGGYVEIGDRGRLRLTPGDVAFHGAFEAHRNEIGDRGAEVVNLPLDFRQTPQFALGRIPDPDAVLRVAGADAADAACLMLASIEPCAQVPGDWPDLLATELGRAPEIALGEWAAAQGLAPESVSRGFQKAFGVSPKRFRAEARTRLALRLLLSSDAPLAQVAANCGFADQAHMTRALRALTGVTPSRWRATGL
jgi:AraC-like DNA-binding protein